LGRQEGKRIGRWALIAHRFSSSYLLDFLLRTFKPYSARRLFRAASTVLLMSDFECARDRNAASNCDGARFTPFASMLRKNFPNRAVSDVLALAKSVTFLSVKKGGEHGTDAG